MTKRRAVIDSATNWAFTAGWAATKGMPERAAQQVFRMAADALWWQDAGGVEQLKKNLARVSPDLDANQLNKHIRRLRVHTTPEATGLSEAELG